MNKHIRFTMFILLAVSVLVSGCGFTRATPTTPTPTQPSPDVIFTSAAQTAEVRRMLTASAQPTATETQIPTETPTPPPTADINATLAATLTMLATTPAVTQPPPPSSGGADNAAFVEDRTIPDGTNFAPGATFVKTWRLINNGTSTWTNAFNLVHISGDALSGSSTAIAVNVAPNQVVDISVDMTAPTALGKYTSYWRMRNANGDLFGDPIYVEINVTADGANSTPQATATSDGQTTPQPSATPNGQTTPQPSATPSSGAAISGVAVAIDQPVVSTSCPHTYAVTGSFTLSQPATVIYQFEAGSDTPGFTFNLPGAVTTDLSAGTHIITLSLNISNAGSGWVRLLISQPENVTSEKANFTLTCQE